MKNGTTKNTKGKAIERRQLLSFLRVLCFFVVPFWQMFGLLDEIEENRCDQLAGRIRKRQTSRCDRLAGLSK